MVCKAILNTGLALCLVFQASAPCCCAFQDSPSVEGSFWHHYHPCPESTPADSPSSDCGICSVLGQAYRLPCCGHELPSNGMPAARPPEVDSAIEASVLATLAACRCDAIPLRDIYEMQTLQE